MTNIDTKDRDIVLELILNNYQSSGETPFNEANFDSSEDDFEYPTGLSPSTAYDAEDPKQKQFFGSLINSFILGNGSSDSIDSELIDLILAEAVSNAGTRPTLTQIINLIKQTLERYDNPNDGDDGDAENDTSDADELFQTFTLTNGKADPDEVKEFFKNLLEDLGLVDDETLNALFTNIGTQDISSEIFKFFLQAFETIVSQKNALQDTTEQEKSDSDKEAEEINQSNLDPQQSFDAIQAEETAAGNNPNDDNIYRWRAINEINDELEKVLPGEDHKDLVREIIHSLTNGVKGDTVTEEIYTAAIQLTEKIIGKDIFENVDSDDASYDVKTGKYSVHVNNNDYEFTPSDATKEKYQTTVGDVFHSLADKEDTTLDLSTVEQYVTSKLQNFGIDPDADLNPSLDYLIQQLFDDKQSLTLTDFTALLASIESASGENIFDSINNPSSNTLSDDSPKTAYNITLPDGSEFNLEVNEKGEYSLNLGTETQKIGSEKQEISLSKEILNETADSYFDNILTTQERNDFSLGLRYQQSEESYNLVSELGDQSSEISFLKNHLKTLLGDSYDEDALEITIPAAKANLADDPTANTKDLFVEVEKIIKGTSEGITKTNNKDDAINITLDFGNEDNLFDALINTSIDPNNVVQSTNGDLSFETNKTLTPATVEAFLEGYLNPNLPQEYLDELLDKADKNNNGTINRDEFKSILKTINNDIGDDNQLGLSKAITDDANITDIDLTNTLPDNFTFNKGATANTTDTEQNITQKTEIYYSTSFSEETLGDTANAFFESILGDNRSTTNFDVPNYVDGKKEISDLTPEDNILFNIKNQLNDKFGASPQIADIIIQTAQKRLDNNDAIPNPTVEDLYNEIEKIIQNPLEKTTKEPNIIKDFGNTQNLFNLLKQGGTSEFNNFNENSTTTFNQYLDPTTLQAFLEGYVPDEELASIDIKEIIKSYNKDDDKKINKEEFELILRQLETEIKEHNGDSIGIEPFEIDPAIRVQNPFLSLVSSKKDSDEN